MLSKDRSPSGHFTPRNHPTTRQILLAAELYDPEGDIYMNGNEDKAWSDKAKTIAWLSMKKSKSPLAAATFAFTYEGQIRSAGLGLCKALTGPDNLGVQVAGLKMTGAEEIAVSPTDVTKLPGFQDWLKKQLRFYLSAKPEALDL